MRSERFISRLPLRLSMIGTRIKSLSTLTNAVQCAMLSSTTPLISRPMSAIVRMGSVWCQGSRAVRTSRVSDHTLGADASAATLGMPGVCTCPLSFAPAIGGCGACEARC